VQKLVLHIGCHKTGSTAIQNYLFYNRLWLKHFGVYYPKPIHGASLLSSNHSDLRDAARAEGQMRSPHIHPRTGPFSKLLDTYIRRIIRADAPLTVLSCEGWSAQMNMFAHRMAPLAEYFDVKVVAVMRRPDYFIESLYRQRIANIEHLETRAFPEFIRTPTMRRAIFDRTSIFGWWGSIFGDENINVIPYEPARPGFDLMDRFFTAAEMPVGAARHLPMRNNRANRSLGPGGVELIRLHHKYGLPVSRSLVRKLRHKSPGGRCSYLTAADRLLLLAAAAPDMQAISNRYVQDGRNMLFPEDPERVEEPVATPPTGLMPVIPVKITPSPQSK